MHNENNLCDSNRNFQKFFTCPGHNMVKIWIFMHKIFSNMLTDEWKISRRVGMSWNFKGRRKRRGDDVDGNYKRRPNSNQAPCYVTINQHEARVNKKRPTFVDPHQQCCAVSNVTSV